MNSPLQTALALSSTGSYASARRDHIARRQVTSRSSGSRRGVFARRRGAAPPPAL